MGSVPTSTAVPPASTIPFRTPADSSGPDGRLSRPTAITGARPRRSHATLAKARPMARPTSAVNSLPTMPRTSYWRKMDLGTFMSLPLVARSGAGQRLSGLSEGRGAPAGEIEKPSRPDAEEDDHRHGERDGAGRRRSDPDSRA